MKVVVDVEEAVQQLVWPGAASGSLSEPSIVIGALGRCWSAGRVIEVSVTVGGLVQMQPGSSRCGVLARSTSAARRERVGTPQRKPGTASEYVVGRK